MFDVVINGHRCLHSAGSARRFEAYCWTTGGYCNQGILLHGLPRALVLERAGDSLGNGHTCYRWIGTLFKLMVALLTPGGVCLSP